MDIAFSYKFTFKRFLGFVVIALCVGTLIYFIFFTQNASSKKMLIGTIIMAIHIVLSLFIGYVNFPRRFECPEWITKNIDLIASKEFAWDGVSRKFEYKDKNRSLSFSPTDISKWASLTGQANVLRLRNGEQIILESIFNHKLNSFININKETLGLPKS